MTEETNNKGMQQAKGGVFAQSDIELLRKSLEFYIKNSDDLDGYEVSELATQRNEIIEPPILRNEYSLFRTERRTCWTELHDSALSMMENHRIVGHFIREVLRWEMRSSVLSLRAVSKKKFALHFLDAEGGFEKDFQNPLEASSEELDQKLDFADKNYIKCMGIPQY